MRLESLSEEMLGVLHWDERRKGYAGSANWAPDQSLAICLIDADTENLSEYLFRIGQSFKQIRADETQIAKAATDALLENYNENWNGEDEDEDEDDEITPMDAETFQGHLALTAITFYGDRTAELFYDNDDLFAGHTVVVSLTENGQFQSASLTG